MNFSYKGVFDSEIGPVFIELCVLAQESDCLVTF